MLANAEQMTSWLRMPTCDFLVSAGVLKMFEFLNEFFEFA